MNPYICAGDSIALEINSDGTEKVELELPEGWTCKVPDKISGIVTVFIKTSVQTKNGAYTVKIKNNSSSTELNCHVVRKI